VPRRLAERYGFEVVEPQLVLEGGSIDPNGASSLLTTESCLLNPNRNPALGRARIEQLLRRYLGVTTVIWLGQGVYLDETGGHIDELACFTSPGHVVLTWTRDREDPQYEISRDAYLRLSKARDARGRELTIHKIHQPRPLYMTEEEAAGIDRRAGSRPRKAGERQRAVSLAVLN